MKTNKFRQSFTRFFEFYQGSGLRRTAGLFLLLLLAVAFTTVVPGMAQGTDLNFFDSLTGPTSPHLSIPSGKYAYTFSGLQRSLSSSQTDRPMVKTVSGAFLTTNFVFELNVTTNVSDLIYVGFGQGLANANFFNEPTNSFLFRIHSHNFGGTSRIDAAVGQNVSGVPFAAIIENIGQYTGATTRFRIERNGDSVTLSVPSIGASHTFQLSSFNLGLDNTNAYLFFGNTNVGTTFSNFSVLSVTNGSFEHGDFTPNQFGFEYLIAGSTDITGWSIDSGSIDWIGTLWAASDGSRSVDLNGNDAGTISQSFTTVVGRTYTVTFDMAGNPECGPASKTLEASAGNTTATFSFDTTGKSLTNMGWTQKSFDFIATSTSTTLTFESLTSSSACGPALDNVKVTVNPDNTPPVAQCENVTVNTSPGLCNAPASVDNGSFDPDDDPITLAQSPSGPYSKGATNVTLTVTDDKGASDFCTATVTVVDAEPPAITCPAPQVVECTGSGSATATFSASASDNCGFASTSCPASGNSFPLGTTQVSCSATDGSGNSSSCNSSVTVVDTIKPTVSCVESVNPSGKNVPKASNTNQDGFYKVGASDTCSTPVIKIGSFTLANGETIKITQTPGKSGVSYVNSMGPGGIRHFQVGPGDAVITATDGSGNSSSVTCLVPPPPK